LFQLKALQKHAANTAGISEIRLQAAFLQNMYLGLSPFDAPATYLSSNIRSYDGVWFEGWNVPVIEDLLI
jgi:hypothetical protein